MCTLNPILTRTEIGERQPNPGRLPPPDMTKAMPAETVAEAVLALDRHPRPEVYLGPRWRILGALSVLTPGIADRLFARRSGFQAPPRRG